MDMWWQGMNPLQYGKKYLLVVLDRELVRLSRFWLISLIGPRVTGKEEEEAAGCAQVRYDGGALSLFGYSTSQMTWLLIGSSHV